MADAINFPGTVEWSGENPGISLKENRRRPVRRARELLSRGALAARARPRADVDAVAAGRQGGEFLLPRQRETRTLSRQRLRLAFRRLERSARTAGPHLPAARQRRGLGRSGEHATARRSRRAIPRPFSPGAASASRSASRCRRTSRRPANIRCRACSFRARARRSASTARCCPASRRHARWRGTSSRPRCWRFPRRGSGRSPTPSPNPPPFRGREHAERAALPTSSADTRS